MTAERQDVFKLFNWDNSLKAIQHLQTLLQCSICNKVAVDPQCLGRCDHFFCAGCITSLQDGKCPQCNIPAHPCDRKPDRIVQSLVACCGDLTTLINGGSIPSITQGREAPDGPPSTPEQPIISLPLSHTAGELLVNGAKGSTPAAKKPKAAATPKNNAGTGKRDGGTAKKSSLPVHRATKTPGGKKGSAAPPPATPEGKKIPRLVDMRALGMSPGGPSVNKRNTKGETPLHVACIKGDEARVRQLLLEGANPNSKDNAGWTPLHEACSHGFVGVAELLLQHGAIVDVPGGSNEAPLHDAVLQGQTEVIRLLRSWGASDTTRNLKGHTPRYLATLCNGASELSAALDTPVDPSLQQVCVVPPLLDKMVVLGAGLSQDQARKLDALVKMLRARLATDFGSEVTHIVAGSKDQVAVQLSPGYMMGVAAGKWILSHTWVTECVTQEVAINPEAYEVLGASHSPVRGAPKAGRKNAEKMRPGLFNGCHMYLWGNFSLTQHNKKVLEGMVRAGGGVVLAREPNPESIPDTECTVPYHAAPDGPLAACSHYIIFPEGPGEPQIKYDMLHVKTLPLTWLLDCLDHFALVPPRK